MRADGTVDVFARNADNAIHHLSIRGAAVEPWDSLGGVASTGPGVVQRRGRPEIDLFYGGSDQSMRHRWWSPSTG